MRAQEIAAAMSPGSSIPMYQQIKDVITSKIHSGEWPAGSMLPSENQLAEALGASRMTVNRPFRELALAGLLKRVHGVGTFVSEPIRQASLIELKPVAEEIRAQGKSHSADILRFKKLKAGRDLAKRLSLPAGAPLIHIVLVHYQDDIPIQLEDRYVNPTVVNDFENVDFSQITPSEYLLQQLKPDQLEHVVQAIKADAFTAQQLQIVPDEPCLRLRRRTWQQDTIVTAVDMIYPGDRYELGARYSP